MRDADKRLFSMQDGGESALTQLLAGMLSAEVEGSRIPSSFGEVYGWLANAYRCANLPTKNPDKSYRFFSNFFIF